MTSDTIRQFLRQQPFAPFTIRMTDGRHFDIKHPDYVALPPGTGTTAIVFLGGERFELIYVRNISGIQSEGPVPTPPQRRGHEPGE